MAKSGICCVDGCGKGPVVARGMCRSHYHRTMTHGSPRGGRLNNGAGVKWLRSHVDPDCDDCLIWPFGRGPNGYGSVSYLGKTCRAHRAMCEIAHGSPPSPSLATAHSCGNGHLGCVNPKHLRWATRAENEADKILHGTSNRGSANRAAKLTESEVLAIFSLKDEYSYDELGPAFGVKPAEIRRILRGEAWFWLTGVPAWQAKPQLGRKKRWAESMQVRLPEGTLGQIDGLKTNNEDRADFIRAAVAAEIERRRMMPNILPPPVGKVSRKAA